MSTLVMARVPARKFRQYECTGNAALESKMRNASAASHEEAGHKKDVVGDVETIERVYGNEKTVADAVETVVAKM